MPTTHSESNHDPPLDPVYRHARREGVEILIAWAVSLLWTILYCWAYGYQTDSANVTLIAGVPSWVFWGVAVPWVASSAFTIWYALFRMRDDPLEDEPPPAAAARDETEA